MSIKNVNPSFVKRVQATNLSPGNSVETFLKKHNLLSRSPTISQRKTTFFDEETEINSYYSNPRKKTFISHLKKKSKIPKSVHFIDLIDKTKPLCEVVEIQAYKTNMIIISNEKENNHCTCNII